MMLPCTMTVLVPIWIARRYGLRPAWPETGLDAVLALAGVLLFVPGVLLFGASVHEFFTRGRGTLAPWDPPRHLVVRGPYRYVRNPMIAGVIFTLFGIALGLRSRPHLVWAIGFLAVNALYIPLVEEPMLEAQFGDDYRRYKSEVRRFVPRLRR